MCGCCSFFEFLLKLWTFIFTLIFFGYLGKLIAWLVKGMTMKDIFTTLQFWIPDEQFWFWAVVIMLVLLMIYGCSILVWRGMCASCNKNKTGDGISMKEKLISDAVRLDVV